MNESLGLTETLNEILQNLIQQIVTLTPRIAAAIVLLLLGFVIAKLSWRVLLSILTRIRVDRLAENIGLANLLGRLGIRFPVSKLIANVTYYLLLIAFVQAAAESLGLAAIRNILHAFFGYLPKLLAAAFVFLLGNIVAQAAGRVVTESSRNSGVEYATGLGRLVSAIVLLVISIMAIAQLGIDTSLLRTVIIIAMAIAGVSIAVAFGLGTREVARNLVAGFYVRKLFPIGRRVVVGKHQGTLRRITSTKTFLDHSGKTVAIANRDMLDGAVEMDSTSG